MSGKTTVATAVLVAVLMACTGAGSSGSQGSGQNDGQSAGSGSGQGGGTTLNGQDIVLASALQPFDDCDGLLDYFKREALKVVGPYGLGGGPIYYADDAVRGAELDSAGAPAGAVGSTAAREAPVAGKDFSGTNVQEEGVDEPDSVKTNGEIVITIANGKLQIVDLADADQVLSTLRLDGWSHELLLDGDRLLVMGAQESNGGPVPLQDTIDVDRGYAGAYSPVSVLTMVDISDPADPQVQATLTLDGAYSSARMTNGVARVVMTSQPTGLEFTYPEGGGLRAEREAEEKNREVIRSSTIDNWLPYYVLEDGRGGNNQASSEGTLLDCADVTHPEEFSGLGLLSVLSVDLGGQLTPEGGTAVVASGETVYASSETLYVTTNRWYDPVLIDTAPEQLPDDYITEIHAFDITDPAAATYVASGAVKGHLLNQFSMSEHDGMLRVATTDGSPWGGTERSESFVTVFERDGGELRRVGQVGDLGKGEQIYAVRFLGDVGYVVTFRQTDPLYTIDLADPTAPRVTGELKILGYSAYLHPIADDLLIGVGQDANKEGQTSGLQVSLFDVADPKDPRRLQQTTIPGGYSDAEYDHRAFLYWPASKLAVVPVQSYVFDQQTQTESYDIGAYAFNVRRTGIDQAGDVRHAPKNDPNAWSGAIRRSIVVRDTLVTVSERGLKVSDLETFADRSFARFE